jgi:hypothetical protein
MQQVFARCTKMISNNRARSPDSALAAQTVFKDSRVRALAALLKDPDESKLDLLDKDVLTELKATLAW